MTRVLGGPRGHQAKVAGLVLKACREQKEKKAIRGLRVLPDHRGSAGCQALKALRDPQGQREKEANRVCGDLREHQAKVAGLVLKACREQKEKKAIRGLRAFPDHRGSVDCPALKDPRDPQGQREIQQIPAGFKTLKTESPNWKRD